MSVVIPGMKMPESCADCILRLHESYYCLVAETGDLPTYSRYEFCPLISVNEITNKSSHVFIKAWDDGKRTWVEGSRG